MFDAARWSEAKVVARRTWEDGLFTLTLDQARDFQAGQFLKLGMNLDGEHVHRSYSIGSAPGRPLEFFIVRVDDGQLTPHIDRLQPGDSILVHDTVAGGFVLEKVPAFGQALWLISTGTGLAPYISMLRHAAVWDRFDKVILVHGVRSASQLAYRDELEQLARERPLSYVPALTREDAPGCLRGRIPQLIHSGVLEAAAGCLVGPHGHFFLCGNPDMVTEMRTLLGDKGLLLHTPRREGNVHMEKYW